MQTRTIVALIGAATFSGSLAMCGGDGTTAAPADAGVDATDAIATDASGGGDATNVDAGDGAPGIDGGGEADAGPAPFGVFTGRNDNGRTGQNLLETALTPANVNPTTFGKLFSVAVDGMVYAQPLFAANVKVADGTTHDVVYVATEHGTVYAFDAGASGAPLWQKSLTMGGTAIPAADTGDPFDIKPEIGITGTPVIDPTTGTLFAVVSTKEAGPVYVQRLHALDIGTGAEKFGGPVAITATSTQTDGGVVTFDPLRHLQRPGLLLANGRVYSAYGSHGDIQPYQGWIIAYDAHTLAPAGAYNATPDGTSSIWQSGDGIAADSSGNLYVETGNGDFDGMKNLGDSAIKISPTGAILDWFTPYNQDYLNQFDIDFGSAGMLLLPDQPGAHPHLAIASGKPGKFYVLDRDNFGHKGAASDNQIVQTIGVNTNTSDAGQELGIFSTPAYFSSNVYIVGVNDAVKQYSVTNGLLSTSPTHQSTRTYIFPGPHISISASGATNGIVWVIDCDGSYPSKPAVLRAYDASDVSQELYGSDQAFANRDLAGVAVKFTVPTIANGRVYVGTQTDLTVFGLLP